MRLRMKAFTEYKGQPVTTATIVGLMILHM